MPHKAIQSSHLSPPYIQLKENNLIQIHDQTFRITHVKYRLGDGWKTVSNLSFLEREALTKNIHKAFESFQKLPSYPPGLKSAPVITVKFAHKMDPQTAGIRKWIKSQAPFTPVELLYQELHTRKQRSFLIEGKNAQEIKMLKQGTEPLSSQLKGLKDKTP